MDRVSSPTRHKDHCLQFISSLARETTLNIVTCPDDASGFEQEALSR